MKLLILTIKLSLTVSLLLTQNLHSEEVITPVDDANNEPKGEPVVVFTDTLFYLKTHIGSFTPQQRAKNVAQRIKGLCTDYYYKQEYLKIAIDRNDYAIMYNDAIIISINPEEAEANNKEPKEFADEIKRKIVVGVAKYREINTLKFLLTEIGLALLLIVCTFLAIKVVNKLYKYFVHKILSFKGNKIKGISIKSYSVCNEEQEVKIILSTLKTMRYAITILLLYLFLPLLFSIFPVTQGVADTLFGYVANPLKSIFQNIVKYIPNLITILVIIFVFRYTIKVLNFFAKEVQIEKVKLAGFYPDWAIPTANVIKTLLFVFMAIIIFPYLPGSDTDAFKGISIFVGVLISLGSTNLIGNAVAGNVLTYMRPFQIGDRIKIGDIEGNVIEKTPFVVRVRTPKNEEITIPNSNILSANTLNYTSSALHTKVAIYLSVTVAYDVPWRRVYELLIESAKKTQFVLDEPQPFVLQIAFDDFFVEYKINAYIVEVNGMPSIYSALRQNIQDAFNAAGIEMTALHYYSSKDENYSSKDGIPKKLD